MKVPFWAKCRNRSFSGQLFSKQFWLQETARRALCGWLTPKSNNNSHRPLSSAPIQFWTQKGSIAPSSEGLGLLIYQSPAKTITHRRLYWNIFCSSTTIYLKFRFRSVQLSPVKLSNEPWNILKIWMRRNIIIGAFQTLWKMGYDYVEISWTTRFQKYFLWTTIQLLVLMLRN